MEFRLQIVLRIQRDKQGFFQVRLDNQINSNVSEWLFLENTTIWELLYVHYSSLHSENYTLVVWVLLVLSVLVFLLSSLLLFL